MKVLKTGLVLGMLLISSTLFGQQLVFSFINPAFGGNPNNASWLLQSAQIQSDYQQKSTDTNSQATSLDDFATQLNNQILYSLANAIIQKQFGTENSSLKTGQYNVGQFRITIGNGGSGLIVNIFDSSTGNQTQITIPNP